ncbi:1809_t:CDS:2 [Funneliformis caledonium]|uniref:1809_t:CDS:1 n=1 Tax=Funneliformis caledonium TaxID=1117310 RepID=A0A9N9EC12_9GLOM|nr:1809_t:CDS:2 [Funneliformis caledonium]
MATNMWDEVIAIKFIEVKNIAEESSKNYDQCNELRSHLISIYEALDARAYHVISDNPFDEKNTENLIQALNESRTFLLNFRKQCIRDFLNSFKLDEISSKFKELVEALIQAQIKILPYMDAFKDLKLNPKNHTQKPKLQLPTSNPIELSPQSQICHDNLVLGKNITYASRPSYCEKKIAVGEVYYHCSIVLVLFALIICDRCFTGSNHVGHDVSKIKNFWLSAWCDCGDYSINCKYHSPTETI